MGIPSFYKHLLQTITGLTAKTRAKPPKAFCLDLNCAIYHCVKKLQKRIPYTHEPDKKAKWETELIAQVIAYIKQLDAYVKPTETLYIGVDGVAPMAKIKQQRARRFKSAQAAEEEGRIRAEANGVPYVQQPRWDTNAITPGTQFMAALASALRTFAKTNPKKIIVSPADEPGEGEQKIMAWIRAKKPSDIVVYGLDADLIVLSLWTSATETVNVDLFREEVEFSGGVKEDALGEEQFLYMNVNHLATTLYERYGKSKTADQRAFICDFVALMSLLGNDFVPHGLTLKIKDEGIETLLELYSTRLDTPLLEFAPWRYNVNTLAKLFKIVASDEDRAIHRAVKKKLEARVGSTASKEAADQALARYNDQPVLWAAEKPMVHQVRVPDREMPSLMLRSDWRTTYDKMALLGADPTVAATIYLESLGWTLAYYSGAPVDMNWYYPWPLPPRIETVAQVCESLKDIPVPQTAQPPLKPVEQLAMVLPETSFHLLPSEYAKLPKKYPYAWPQQWEVYSFGRRFLWECEPLVPLIQPKQIKTWIEELYD